MPASSPKNADRGPQANIKIAQKSKYQNITGPVAGGRGGRDERPGNRKRWIGRVVIQPAPGAETGAPPATGLCFHTCPLPPLATRHPRVFASTGLTSPPPAHPIKIKAKRAGTGGPGSVSVSPRVPGATPRWKTIGTGLRSHLFSPLPVPPLPPRGMPFLNLSDALRSRGPNPKNKISKYQNIKISALRSQAKNGNIKMSKISLFRILKQNIFIKTIGRRGQSQNIRFDILISAVL